GAGRRHRRRRAVAGCRRARRRVLTVRGHGSPPHTLRQAQVTGSRVTARTRSSGRVQETKTMKLNQLVVLLGAFALVGCEDLGDDDKETGFLDTDSGLVDT